MQYFTEYECGDHGIQRAIIKSNQQRIIIITLLAVNLEACSSAGEICALIRKHEGICLKLLISQHFLK